MKKWMEQLSPDEQNLLLEVLFNQRYALEIISSELADMESGQKQVDEARYRHLVKLYERIYNELSL
ncbi:antirepressor AbbA [Anoxybacteroides amylolyticum]|uniref:Antirepressor AbbA family protein n=1 Tax=Anoxybacteroides amylolyticum TaxID=294699 RepID=A0A160F4E2_9BACL|nr:antirepressor AbbA [Anoxybacillus amylolyticus]ANB60772.1 antirepressor AbbA family protein [Anoxybacillus amylolyticus]